MENRPGPPGKMGIFHGDLLVKLEGAKNEGLKDEVPFVKVVIFRFKMLPSLSWTQPLKSYIPHRKVVFQPSFSGAMLNSWYPIW